MEESNFTVLYDISSDDLKVSKILFRKRMYPHSLFYLQQTIEKLIKYIGLSNGIIQKEDLFNKVGHNTTRIFKKALKDYQAQGEEINVDEIFREIATFIDNSPTDIVVGSMKTEIQNILKNGQELPFDIDAINTPEDLYNTIKRFKPGSPDLEQLRTMPHNQEFTTRLQSFKQNFKQTFPEYIKAIIVLFIINCLISKHVSKVRYPEITNMVNPKNKYTKQNEIVNSIPFFHKKLEYCLIKLKKITTANGVA